MRRLGIAAIGLISVLSVACLGQTEARAEKPIPQAPYYYILDEPKVLSEGAFKSIASLLIEHDRSTGEQVVFAVFDSLDGEDYVAYTNRVFSDWKIGQRGKDNGVLLALYWKEHKARIEVGYGLEPILTDAKSKLILEETLIPELKAGNPDRALSLAALQILTVLDSPLVHSGQAQQILKAGGFQGALRPTQTTSSGWTVWLFVGLLLFIFVINALSAAEAHYTSRGWYRARPWRRRSIWWGGGGGWGGGFGGGGFGGFGGGGGRSGGGGASGSW